MAPRPSAPARSPRSNPERRADTRARLLQATLDELVASGYAGLKTAAVCVRAGLSKGALFDHFPSKQSLLVAAAEDWNERARADAAVRLEALRDAADRLERSVEYLWSVYADPVQIALTEVYMASRADVELARALHRVALRHRTGIRAVASALFPEAARRPEFQGAVDVGLAAILGGAILEHTGPPAPERGRDLRFLVELLRPHLAESAGAEARADRGDA